MIIRIAAALSSYNIVGSDCGWPSSERMDRRYFAIFAACTAAMNSASVELVDTVPRFYRELKSFVVNGEGWSYIKKYEKTRHGNKAYLALKTQCEATASKIRERTKRMLR